MKKVNGKGGWEQSTAPFFGLDGSAAMCFHHRLLSLSAFNNCLIHASSIQLCVFPRHRHHYDYGH